MKLQLLLGPMLGLLMLVTGRAQAQAHVCGAARGLVGECLRETVSRPIRFAIGCKNPDRRIGANPNPRSANVTC
jgi:hypothetical protein